MHLILVINSLGIGGAERVLIRLAKAWAKDGHRISFVTFFSEKTNYYNLLDGSIYSNNIQLINLGEPKPSGSESKLNFVEQLFRISKRILVLRKLFKRLQPDLIVSFLVGVNISVLLANLGKNFPVIVSERIDPAKHLVPKIYKILRLATYRIASAIVVQTQSVLDYFIDQLPGKVHKNLIIIPNFVKAPKAIKNLDNPSRISKIISVGRLDQQKDQQLLIRAFAELVNNKQMGLDLAVNPKILTLTIYGEGELREELEDLVKRLDLIDRVFLPGISKDIEQTLVTGDLFVFPSKYEGFPNALSEAMSCGLPVIASSCSGNKDLIEHGINGLLFEPGDLVGLVTSMQQLLNNPSQCNKLAAAAMEVVNSFSEPKILELWNNVLQFAK